MGPLGDQGGVGAAEKAEPPHEHSYTQKHDARTALAGVLLRRQKGCGGSQLRAHGTADGNTESRTCTVCGYAETRDAAQTSATGGNHG